jgi:hypothetical protein
LLKYIYVYIFSTRCGFFFLQFFYIYSLLLLLLLLLLRSAFVFLLFCVFWVRGFSHPGFVARERERESASVAVRGSARELTAHSRAHSPQPPAGQAAGSHKI